MFDFIKNWIISVASVKVVEAILKNVDATEYATIAADSVDKYLDKTLGEKPSEEVQVKISAWLVDAVKIFTDKLKAN